MKSDSKNAGEPPAAASGAPGVPAVADRAAWQAELDALLVREKAHTREGDAIAAARRRLPMVEVDPSVTLTGCRMDVLVSVDMEGVAGIATRQQTHPAGHDYAIARALMTAEANAAVAGAFNGGATSVVVNDSHGPMDNLLGEQLDQRADYVIGDPKPLDMMQEVTPQTGVVLFVGYHAGAADPAGVLAHAYSGSGFADVRLNGRSISEAELNALIAATAGVPVGLVTGDDVICAVAEKAFPGPVKTALGRTAARSRHPAAAREAIAAGAARALASAASGAIQPVAIPDELVIEADLRLNGAAELAALVPGTERAGASTVRYQAADPRAAMNVLIVWYTLASQYLSR